MSNTTSINELPTDPAGGGGIQNNIGLITSENNATLEQSTINQIINGLQQATATGATSLPSRDIPTTTTQITNDPYIQPNYVPQDAKYIEETETPEETIQTYNKNVHREESLDTLYNQIQIPLLLSILYFIFQLPIVKNTLFKYLPVLFNIDGNINLSGLITMSALFGASYYIISNTMTTISSI